MTAYEWLWGPEGLIWENMSGYKGHMASYDNIWAVMRATWPHMTEYEWLWGPHGLIWQHMNGYEGFEFCLFFCSSLLDLGLHCLDSAFFCAAMAAKKTAAAAPKLRAASKRPDSKGKAEEVQPEEPMEPKEDEEQSACTARGASKQEKEDRAEGRG